MSVSVIGLGETIAALTGRLALCEIEAMKITEASAHAIASEADSNVPVDTGDLKASQVVRPFTDGSTKGWEVGYGETLPPTGKTYSYPGGLDANTYALLVELGTRFHAAQPYLTPAYDKEKTLWQAALSAL